MVDRVWRPGRPCPVGALLAPLRRGAGDPTYRRDGDDHWLGLRAPTGAATLRVRSEPALGEVHAQAWGPGADWALERLPALLGDADDPAGFTPHHDLVARAWERHPDLRIGRTDRVMEALVPAVIEQKVTGQEAFAGFRSLVHRHGERAPGPGGERRLWLQPGPEALRRVPSWEWLRMHIDPARSRPLVRAAGVAGSLERLVTLDGDEADRRLRSLPGIGVWTSAEVRQRALGDADAVSFGDYHLAKEVGWALFGHDIDDERLAEVLEPYRPHRGRAAMLILLAGRRRPRRGPRMAPRTHLPAG
ncbi:DNA-3-methyladenine glycosylase [Nocardioides sp.]|uniref:DNA-3-methyladenine glycosylase family protein n=1 Tax=Nocardioides sp. TaxID=35761 RepID=UPI0035288FD7